jgi:hypothetical protein
MKNLAITTEEISNLTTNNTTALTQKMARGFEKGDDKSYADDLRNMTNNMK